MITADNGVFKINGERTAIVFELNMIFEYFIEENPEILGGVLAAWNDKLESALSTGYKSRDVIDHARKLSEYFISRELSEHFNNLNGKPEKEGDIDDKR